MGGKPLQFTKALMKEFVGVAVGIKDEFVGVTVKVDVTDTVCVLVLVGVGVL